ncbi:MAG: insulinase family protein [Deltaproteobacteria bacterium]|nr:insulinase family protein [Deltaproteobacteria bacterium]
MIPFQKVELTTGLSVVTLEQPHLHSADLSLFVKCGSRYEAPRHWGLSHLLEHMLYRGSARFPDTKKLARAFERSGGTLQAATWRDHTRLSLSIHPSRMQAALGVLADMVQHPTLCDLETERAIVAEELRAELDEDGADAEINNLSRAAVWRDHAMGRRIAGSLATVPAFTERDLTDHHARHYVGQNMVLTVAGKVRADEVVDLAAAAFKGLAKGERTADGVAARFRPRARLVLRRVPASQLAVQLTFEALPDTHADFPTLVLLSRLLDEGVGSRLQQAVAERRGLVYELGTTLDCYADCGLLDIELKAAPRRAATAVAATLEALGEICAEGLTAEELDTVRERELNDLEFEVDSPSDLAADFGAATLLSEPKPLEARALRLQAITLADLNRVARTVFQSGRLHGTLVGPVDRANIKRIESLLNGFAKDPS